MRTVIQSTVETIESLEQVLRETREYNDLLTGILSKKLISDLTTLGYVELATDPASKRRARNIAKAVLEHPTTIQNILETHLLKKGVALMEM